MPVAICGNIRAVMAHSQRNLKQFARLETATLEQLMAESDFEMQAGASLSRLILPPEIDPLLLIFRRKPTPSA